MGIQIAGFTVGNIAEVDLTPKALRTIPYGASGALLCPANGAAVTATQGYHVIGGIHGGKEVQSIRVSETGVVRTTSETMLWQDAFELAVINLFWTQSLATMTAVQLAGLLTLNNAAITTLNTQAIITSQRQFPRYPRNPLFVRWRMRITNNAAANHTLVELGLGAPSGVVVIITNGFFFRWRADGALEAVISFNGTEQTTLMLAQGVINVNNYYFYDIVVFDDYVQFTVTDSSNIPVADVIVYQTVTQPSLAPVSHHPTFCRVYVDTVGGGTAIQVLISAHQVQLIDGLTNKPWEDQMASAMRHASIDPTTYAQTTRLANAGVSAAVAPTNTTVTTATLGGEYNNLATLGAETLMSIFGYTIPSPYSFFLKGVYIEAPIVQGAAVVTAALLQWFVAPNAVVNLSTAGANMQRIALPGFHLAAAAAAIGVQFSGGKIGIQFRTPILCLPGSVLHIGYKSITGAATALLAYRGQCFVDGYFE
jgi:hypothetical protein